MPWSPRVQNHLERPALAGTRRNGRFWGDPADHCPGKGTRLMQKNAPPLRIAICQPALPHYRAPVYALLGAQEGISLTVFAGGRLGGMEPGRGARSYESRIGPLWRLRMLGRALCFQPFQLQIMDPRRFDLVILDWDGNYLSLPVAMALGALRGVPVALWGHGYSKHPGRLRDAIRNAYGRRADAVVLYTHSVAEALATQEGYARERVFVAQNALDQAPILAAREHWLARPEELQAFARQHRLSPGRTLLFVSRLEAENRVDLLLEATARLCAWDPAVRTVIVGDGAELPRLQALAAELGMQDHVLFAGRIYDDLTLAPWALSASLFCYPQNIGLSILHAFGYGLPVVTCDNIAAQNPEIEALAHGVNGLLYRCEDTDHLAEQCKSILDNPQLRQRMSEAALRTVAERFSLENMVQGFLDLAQRVDGRQRVVRPLAASRWAETEQR